jgi:hypothetical protein
MHRLTSQHAARLLAAALVVAAATTLAPAAIRAQQQRGAVARADTGRTETGATGSGLAPAPGLSPEDVVAIQLDALRHNDTPSRDAGIATTFRFASPANRVATGPLDHFADLVKTSAYRAMINHRRVERGPMHIDGDDARQRVVVYSATGARVAYMFFLSRQHGGPYDGCWMTDGVTRIDDTGPRVDGLRSA